MNPTARRIGGLTLTITFATIMIGAGHGAGPVGLLLIFGRAPEWVAPQFVGGVAIVLEFIAFLRVEKENWRLLAALSLGAFFASAALFVVNSETLGYLSAFFIFMIPFILAAIFRLVQVIFGKNESA